MKLAESCLYEQKTEWNPPQLLPAIDFVVVSPVHEGRRVAATSHSAGHGAAVPNERTHALVVNNVHFTVLGASRVLKTRYTFRV